MANGQYWYKHREKDTAQSSFHHNNDTEGEGDSVLAAGTYMVTYIIWRAFQSAGWGWLRWRGHCTGYVGCQTLAVSSPRGGEWAGQHGGGGGGDSDPWGTVSLGGVFCLGAPWCPKVFLSHHEGGHDPLLNFCIYFTHCIISPFIVHCSFFISNSVYALPK